MEFCYVFGKYFFLGVSYFVLVIVSQFVGYYFYQELFEFKFIVDSFILCNDFGYGNVGYVMYQLQSEDFVEGFVFGVDGEGDVDDVFVVDVVDGIKFVKFVIGMQVYVVVDSVVDVEGVVIYMFDGFDVGLFGLFCDWVEIIVVLGKIILGWVLYCWV